MSKRLVQRYLDQLVAEYAGVDDGALADYIPELACVDPAGFGLTLSSSDGFLYESGDARTEFTIQSISKPFTYALALELAGQDAVDAKIGVEPSGDAFNEISVDEHTKIPKNAMINAGAIAAVSMIPAPAPTSVSPKFGTSTRRAPGGPWNSTSTSTTRRKPLETATGRSPTC